MRGGFRYLVGKFFSRTVSHCLNCITAQAVPGLAQQGCTEIAAVRSKLPDRFAGTPARSRYDWTT
jgi:hypothetical protein